MAASPDDLFALLDRLGIRVSTVSHPPLFTVEQSRALRGNIPGAHIKNLFLKDKNDALFLVVALEETSVNLKTLHKRLGCGRLSFGSPQLLRGVLGVEPGSVTPFAAINDGEGVVSIVLDQDMLSHDILNCHPLTNTMTTSIARDDLLAVLTASGHPPRIINLTDLAAAD